jgi:hypothetical protein
LFAGWYIGEGRCCPKHCGSSHTCELQTDEEETCAGKKSSHNHERHNQATDDDNPEEDFESA